MEVQLLSFVSLSWASLVALGLIATVLGVVNIVRLKEIHHLVNRNFSEQRAEIATLHVQLDQALRSVTLAEEALQQQRRVPASS